MLLDEESPAVQQYLCKSQQKEMKGWDSSTIDAHRAAWQKVGKRWQASWPDDVDDQSAFFQTLTARERDVVTYHRHVTPVDQGAQSKGVDVSQSITRRPCTKEAEDGRILAPTIVPRSKIWLSLRKADTSVHRILVGKESLMIQGWPVDDARLEAFVDKHSNLFLQDLAGNAFPGTVIAAILVAVLFAADAKESQDPQSTVASQEDVEAAFACFKRARGMK